MFFSSVGQNKRGRLVTCSDDNIRWKFWFGSYIPRRRLESVIVKYSKYPHQCSDWQLHIHLKTLDSSALEPCRNTGSQPRARKINRDGDKEVKVTDCSFNKTVHISSQHITLDLKNVLLNVEIKINKCCSLLVHVNKSNLIVIYYQHFYLSFYEHSCTFTNRLAL